MDDIDLKGLLGDLGKTKIDGSVLGMFKEVKEMLHAAKGVVEEFKAIVDLGDKMGIKPLLIRAAAKKLEVDGESPLQSENTIAPQTEAHKLILNQINGLNPKQLAEFVTQIQSVSQPAQKK